MATRTKITQLKAIVSIVVAARIEKNCLTSGAVQIRGSEVGMGSGGSIQSRLRCNKRKAY